MKPEQPLRRTKGRFLDSALHVAATPWSLRTATNRDSAERLGVAIHRVKYAIERRHVEPAMRAGITRVWAEEHLPRIQSALDQIAANKESGR